MTPEEARIIAWTLLGEAAGEGQLGLEAVAHVIRNRALSGRYPSNPAMVAIQGTRKGTQTIYQFSAWNHPSNGGNQPRARYPVGSEAMNRALSIVAKVFSATPGNDPTEGALHYYSTSMRNPPYWWNSEAPNGGKQIGNHIFAVRNKTPVTPVMPEIRPADLGQPRAQVRLPEIAPAPSPTGLQKVSGFPTPMPTEIEWIRQNNDIVSTTWLTPDPVTEELRVTRTEFQGPPMPTKQYQVVAGFAMPPDTIHRAEMTRQLERQGTSYVERDPPKATPKPNQQTVFGPSSTPKTEERLVTTAPPYPGGARSRDSIAQAEAGKATAAKLAAGTLLPQAVPVAPKPVQQKPVPVVVPQQQVIYVEPTAPLVPQIRGSSTGNAYNVGQSYRMGGDTYTAREDGSFTNDRTGRPTAIGTDWQARHGLN